MWMFLLSLAHAAPTGFDELRTWGDCIIYRRGPLPGHPAALRVECDWTDVDVEALAGMFQHFDRYDQWLWPIRTSEVRRTETDRVLVYQLQRIWGISDREVLLWARSETLPGGFRSSWTTANTEALKLNKGSVRTPHNEGLWQATRASKGSKVVHQIEVDAGGVALPRWLVRAIQTRGLGRLMDDVHTRAAAETGQLKK